MAFTDNIPAVGNTLASDVPAMKTNFSFLKTALQMVFTGWDNSDPTALVPTLDTISEKTAATGVTVDGCLFKDGVRKGAAVKLGSFTLPSAAGNYSVTGVGFRPKAVIFLTVVNPPMTEFAIMGIGWMTSSAQGSVTTYVTQATFRAATDHASDKCIYRINYDGSTAKSAAYVSMDADGFTVNCSSGIQTTHAYWLAIG